ncbi:hypothetical protein [Enterococcus wangshanyuanii]|uniref:Phage protein n=2 Tax=Enterococcus wangshanyuanii TaxID=2005703 RepID=A0ABQ1P0D5_9ENTE|nr:hypothetical protein [Enterococcus wangshanyuanii]GGC84367.1 hypothetical protein GCM10011573_12510 [Enterococcus wangshanyuanii]
MLKTELEWQETIKKISEASRIFGVEMTDWQIDAMMYSFESPMEIDLTEFEKLTKPNLILKGDKRNGAMSRQRAFGKLFRERGK